MSSCCSMPQPADFTPGICPASGTRGRHVGLLTLKSLLRPAALELVDAEATYYFCPEPSCDVVYFGAGQSAFYVSDLKVPVHPKDAGEDVPVCYCFGWSRRRLRDDIRQHGRSTAPERIKANVQRGICGCEVNNPQGSCCLGNVQRVVRELEAEERLQPLTVRADGDESR